ncbi:MAG: hypothetical protein SGCHY_005525, partial [Lobulomycetales sp.]
MSNPCRSCGKTVYFAEQVLGPGGAYFHRPCFKCMDCKKGLDSMNCTENDGK